MSDTTTQTSVTSQSDKAGIPPTDPLYQEAVKVGLLPPEPVPGVIQPYKITVETTVQRETTRTTTYTPEDTPPSEGEQDSEKEALGTAAESETPPATHTVNATVIDMQPTTPEEQEAYKTGGVGGLLICLQKNGKLDTPGYAPGYAPGSVTKNTTLFTSEAQAYNHARALHIPEGFVVLRQDMFGLCLYCVVIRRDTDKSKVTLLKVGDTQTEALWYEGQSLSAPGVVTLLAL